MEFAVYGGLFLLNMPLFRYIGGWFFDDLLDCLFFLRYLGTSQHFPEIYGELWDDMVRFAKFVVWVAICMALFGAECAIVRGLLWPD